MNHASTTSDGGASHRRFHRRARPASPAPGTTDVLTRAAAGRRPHLGRGPRRVVPRRARVDRGADAAGGRRAVGLGRRGRVLAWRQQGPPADARTPGPAGRRPPAASTTGSSRRWTSSNGGRRSPMAPSRSLLLDDTARRVADDDIELVVPSATRARRDVPGRGRGRRACWCSRSSAREPVGRAGRAVAALGVSGAAGARGDARRCARRTRRRRSPCARRPRRPLAGWCPTSRCACRMRRARRG